MDLVSELRFDKVHCAAYSTRPGTTAHRTMEDDVPKEVKDRRMKELDSLQESILRETNSVLVGQTLEVLVEGRKRGKWQGRTRTDKLVFLNEDEDIGNSICPGRLVNVEISQASPWALQGQTGAKSKEGFPTPA
jgi:tRNA-2-methylthio-N6-dimethylallyladenosine synthase